MMTPGDQVQVGPGAAYPDPGKPTHKENGRRAAAEPGQSAGKYYVA